MPLTSLRPIVGYSLFVSLLALLATILQSTTLIWLASAAYIAGWIVFLTNAFRGNR